MAITLITTPKATDANSYASVAEADSYHETHLYSDAWDASNDEKKKAALVWATRLLDSELEFTGWRTTIDQKLSWPRVGVWTRDDTYVDEDTIPTFVIEATSELARKLIEADRTAEPSTKGYTEIAVGSISLSIDKDDAQLDPIPDSVMDMLIDYAELVAGGNFVKVRRT